MQFWKNVHYQLKSADFFLKCQILEKLIIANKLALSKNKKSIVFLSLITLVYLIYSINVWHFAMKHPVSNKILHNHFVAE